MMVEKTSTPQSSCHPVIAGVAWLAAVGALALIRYRGNLAPFKNFHNWMAEQGVVDWARKLDSPALLIICGIILWLLFYVTSRDSAKGIWSDIALHRGVLQGSVVGLVIASPMLLLAMVLGQGVFFEPNMIHLVVIGPFAEEWFFRGVLVLALVRLTGVNFWAAAIVSASLFGLAHLSWTLDAFASNWPIFLIVGAGGIWYAWLAREWSRNLWVVFSLHALMNLSWYWYAGTDDAAGTLLPNIGRGATIVFGTVMTIRPQWFRMAWARVGDG